MIEFSLNGKIAKANDGDTILDVAKREGVDIPHLCFKEGLACAGNCRACVVEIEGERTLAPSCCRQVQPGMVVHSNNERAEKAQRMVLELLSANMPEQAHRPDSELDHYSRAVGLQGSRFERREQPASDTSHPAITVNMDACIQCTRCVRACREEQGNAVIGLAWRGDHAQIVFDMSDPLAESTCVACGECVQACPTGALMSTSWVKAGVPQQTHAVDSLCPFCGVGCQVTYHVKEDRIVRVEGRDGPANDSRLCVKGRYGFDYVHHPERLTQPLVRREDAPKQAHRDWTAQSAMAQFRPATWDEVFEKIGQQFKGILAKHGNQSLAGFGSAKCSNEEAYLFQKLVRTGFGNHHVDHCTRLCHASSVAALLEGLGSGAVSNPVKDAMKAEVIVVIGANPTVNHPVGATWMKNAVADGAKLIVMDPRQSDLTHIATHHIQFKPDTDVALLNAMLHVIVSENLVDHEFVARRTEGYDAFIKNLTPFTPDAMAPVCGIDADTIRQIARMYATSKASIIFWGMGVSQHIHGTDNARCLIALALLTGQIGRPGTGLHPLRGQNNVQGASDAGLIPMMFPDYQKVSDAKAKAFFEE
uniref:molybdopterin-dependent oxidoreductase n=1 Tax=Limnobacter sp. TaxID=2003368 RepID=UPI00258C3629